MAFAQKIGVRLMLFGNLHFFQLVFIKNCFWIFKKIEKLLREKIYTKLTHIGTSYKDKISIAEVVQIITLGVNQLEVYFFQYLPQLFNILIAPIVPVVILSNLSYNLVHTQASGGRVFSLLEEPMKL